MHRYYDPNTGRYITPDPVVSLLARTGSALSAVTTRTIRALTVDPFAYVANNPLAGTDSRGLGKDRDSLDECDSVHKMCLASCDLIDDPNMGTVESCKQQCDASQKKCYENCPDTWGDTCERP